MGKLLFSRRVFGLVVPAAFVVAMPASAADIQLASPLDLTPYSATFQVSQSATPPALIDDLFAFTVTRTATVDLVVQSYNDYAAGGGTPGFDVGGLGLSLLDSNRNFLALSSGTALDRTLIAVLSPGAYLAEVTGTVSGPALAIYRTTFSAAPVPEPATWVLFALGAAAYAVLAARRGA